MSAVRRDVTELKGQTEDAEDITVVGWRFVLVRHRCHKYRSRCNGCVATAPEPLRLATRPDARGTRYAPEFAIEVAVGKYLDLERFHHRRRPVLASLLRT